MNIDRRMPWTRAPHAAVAGRNAVASLMYSVRDSRPNGGSALVAIRIKNSSARVVKTLKLGTRRVNPAKAFTAKFRVPGGWKTGIYRFFVYATDSVGNV